MHGETRSTTPARSSTAALENMRFPYTLPALPYEPDALCPVISAKTLRCRYAAHHRIYSSALNQAIDNTDFETMPLKAVIQATAGTAWFPQSPAWSTSCSTGNVQPAISPHEFLIKTKGTP